MKKRIDVAAALIRREATILLCQRNPHDRYGGLWEFPGGVIEANEEPRQAIEREIAEELGLIVKVQEFIHDFSDEDEDLIIDISLFSCRVVSGSPSPKDCQDFGFFTFEEIGKLDLAPADIKIAAYLKTHLQRSGHFSTS